MAYDVEAFRFRAEECVRLANLAKDEMIQRELLSLRQSYLRTVERLAGMAGAVSQEPGPGVPRIRA